MRVVLVNRYFHPDESATSRMVSSLAFALAAQGVAVTALCSRGHRDGSEGDLPAAERVRGVDIVRLRATRLDRGGLGGRAVDYVAFHFAAAAWLGRRVRRGDVCVVCTDPPFNTVSAALPIALRGGRMVNWVMDLFPETAIELGVVARDGAKTRAALALRDWSLRRAARVVCPIDAMRRHLAARGVPAERLIVLRHWSDALEIRPVARDGNALRGAWGLEGKFVVGYSGNFGRAHDFTTLLGAAQSLAGADEVRFLMIGDGARRAWVEAEVRKRRLHNVIFKPLQPPERLSESLGAADVHLVSLLPELEHCILPSKFYGILAAGRPTLFVGDPRGEVATVAAAAKCGESVAVGDAAGLARRIAALRDDPVRCAAMGARARDLLLAEYSRERAVAAWSGLLAELGTGAPSALPQIQKREAAS